MAELKPPPARLLLAEWPRGAWTLARLGVARGMRGDPRGDGRPILLLPGLFNSDRSNFALRRYLLAQGYAAQGWGLGRNFGSRTIGWEGEVLADRIRQMAAEAGEPVTLIGVSLGGIMARLMAHRHPELVRAVMTISSPFAATPRATNVWRLFEWLSGERIDDPRVVALAAEIARPLPVPTAAIWSASDGLVAGHACYDATCEAIEVRSSHIAVQLNPDVLRIVGDVLQRWPSVPTR